MNCHQFLDMAYYLFSARLLILKLGFQKEGHGGMTQAWGAVTKQAALPALRLSAFLLKLAGPPEWTPPSSRPPVPPQRICFLGYLQIIPKCEFVHFLIISQGLLIKIN